MTRKKSAQTALIHTDYTAPEGFAAFPSAIHHASTVLFKNVAAMRSGDWKEKNAYTYGLHGTPTTFTLEARLAEIEDGRHCLLAPSGLAAIAMVDFALLKTGDDVLLPDNVYNPNRELGKWLSQDFGVTARYYDPLVGAGIAALIQPNTKLIWTEAPGSVSMEVPDLPAICAAAHARGVLVALDNTWSAGLALRGFELGVDIVMQALTKYQSGGSDVLMGAVITRDAALHERLSLAHMRLGMGVGADDAYLDNPVPEEVREERRGRVMLLQEEISKQRLQAKVGKTVRVLIDEVTTRGAVGRSSADAPEIDGVVHIKGSLMPGKKLSVGQFVDVTITAADAHDLWAQVA